MGRISPKRTLIFIGVLACIAGVLYGWQYSRDSRKAAEMANVQRKNREAAKAKKKAEEKKQAELKVEHDAAIAHAEFISQYEDTNFSRTPNLELIAVTCASEDGTIDQAVGAALASRFSAKNLQCTTSFFKPTLITQGLFNDVFDGAGDTFRKLDLTKYLDGLLLAKQDVQYSTHGDLENVVTADMHVQIVTLPVSGPIESQSWTLAAKGTGFNKADARMQAEQRIIQQIKDSSTMSLSQTANR